MAKVVDIVEDLTFLFFSIARQVVYHLNYFHIIGKIVG